MPRLPLPTAGLQPPSGPALGLNEGETWIGRGSFEASRRAQLICSRKQACLRYTETGLWLECHGCNPIYFVACHSRNSFSTQDTPPIELYQLRKGESVKLSNGDQFYFVATECLLTVHIGQSGAVPSLQKLSQALPLQNTVAANKADVEHLEPHLAHLGEVSWRSPEPDISITGNHTATTDEQQNCALPQEVLTSLVKDSTADPPEIQLKTAVKDEPLISTDPSQEIGLVDVKPSQLGPVQGGGAECPALSTCAEDETTKQIASGELEKDVLRNDYESADCKPPRTVHEALPEGSVSRGVKTCIPCILPTRTSPLKVEGAAWPAASSEASDSLRLQREAEEQVGGAIRNSNAQADIVTPPDAKHAQWSPVGDLQTDAQCAKETLLDLLQGTGEFPVNSATKACGDDRRSAQTARIESIANDEPPRSALHAPPPEQVSVLTNQAETLNSGLLDPGQGSRGTWSRSDLRECSDEQVLEDLVVEEYLSEAGKVVDEQIEHEVTIHEAWPEGPVEGMRDVIASATGYEGHDLQNLVMLINRTGAAYTGGLSNANTHLVCWNFRGKKFNKAMKLHTVVVNHHWFEDCLRVGKRISEEPYKLESGEEVGPLQWKSPPVQLASKSVEPVISNPDVHQPRSLPGLLSPPNKHQGKNDRGKSDHHGQCSSPARADLQEKLPYSLGQAEVAAVGDMEAEHSRPRKLRKLVKANATDCRTKRPLSEGLRSLGRGENAGPGSCSNRVELPSYRVGPSGDASKFGHVSPLGGLVELAPTDVALSGGRKVRKLVIGSNMDCRNKGPVIADLESLVRNELGAFGLCSEKIGEVDRGKRPSTGALGIINLGDDIKDGVLEPASLSTQDEKTKGRSSQSTDGADGESHTSRNTQSSQSSQPTSLDREIMCAICLAEAKSASEGLLGCGHDFCFTCISKWTNEAKNESTCPLCKAPFDIITKQELDAEGNIKETVVAVGKKAGPSAQSRSTSISLDAICIECGSSDTEAMLIRCGNCGERACHSFCLDPPAPPPWFCSRCTQGRHRESVRLAWDEFLPRAPTGANPAANQEMTLRSSVRRRRQPYMVRQPARPEHHTYIPSLNREVMNNMGPLRRRSVIGQDSLRSWLLQDPDGS